MNARAAWIFGVLAASFAWVGAPGQAQPVGGRTTVVLSDLRMGMGRDNSGAWHVWEDFRWAEEFSAFLRAIDRDGKSTVDLVLNGDSFDFPQAGDSDCAASATGCSEPELLARMERVASAHGAEIAALRTFADRGTNHLTVVPGDADSALLRPVVHQRLIRLLGASPGRVEIASAGYWLSRDGRLHAEHGHQLPGSPDRIGGWPTASPSDTRQGTLTPSVGQRLTLALYRDLEKRFALVDNIAMGGAGLKRALGADGERSASSITPELLQYLIVSTINWQQFRMELDDGDVEPPTWRLEDVRAQAGAFLMSTLPNDDPMRPLVTTVLTSDALNAVAASMSEDELVMLCDYRAAVRRARRRYEPAVTQFEPRGPAVTECPRTPETRGGLYDYFWRSRDRRYSRYVDEVRQRVRPDARPDVFVLGHTLLPDRAQDRANMISGGLLKIPMEGFSPTRGSLTPLVINGGSWQRTVTPVQLQQRFGDRPFASLQPEDLAPCYSFVEVPAYTEAPSPRVRFWRRDGAGAWGVASDCSGS